MFTEFLPGATVLDKMSRAPRAPSSSSAATPEVCKRRNYGTWGGTSICGAWLSNCGVFRRLQVRFWAVRFLSACGQILSHCRLVGEINAPNRANRRILCLPVWCPNTNVNEDCRITTKKLMRQSLWSSEDKIRHYFQCRIGGRGFCVFQSGVLTQMLTKCVF